jgi:phosphate transport system protein
MDRAKDTTKSTPFVRHLCGSSPSAGTCLSSSDTHCSRGTRRNLAAQIFGILHSLAFNIRNRLVCTKLRIRCWKNSHLHDVMRSKKTKPAGPREPHEMTELAVRACLVASDAAFNIKDFLVNSSRVALLAVRDCERELDRIEQQIDQQLPAAIAQVTEVEARELLACLRFSTDLERIGDLLWGVGQRVNNLRSPLPRQDSGQLIEMVEILERMLQQVREGFSKRELDPAGDVLREDREIDQAYKNLVRRHLQVAENASLPHSADVLLMAQALERAGDHATNLAEELFRLIQGRSLRHTPKKRLHD